MPQVADTLHWITPVLSPELVDPIYIPDLYEIASNFSVELARCFDFEFKLDAQAAAADFLICITRRERDAVVRTQFWEQVAPALQSYATWQRIGRFLQAWANPESSLYDNVLMTWLEFDLPGAQSSLLSPGFFFGTEKIPEIRGGDYRWIFKEALPLISEQPPSIMLEKTLRRCIEALPEGAHMYQIGLFPGRKGSPLRGCLTGIQPTDIPNYLRAIGFPDDIKPLERIIEAMAPVAYLHLDIDFVDCVLPKIGIECSSEGEAFIGDAEKDAMMLNRLCSLGLCDAPRRDAILRLPGYADSRALSTGLLAPEEDHNMLPDTILTQRRDLSHVKIVYQPGKPFVSKAYLRVVQQHMPALNAARYALAYQAREKVTEKIFSKPSDC